MKPNTEGDNAFYIFDKPENLYSRKVLRAIPLSPNQRKIKSGIEGILDPFATGVIIAATGYCTRFLSYFHQLTKTYIATITLGKETDTLDRDGKVIFETSVPRLNDALLKDTAAKFTGKLKQRPPVFSNVRVDGERARVTARKGQTIEMPEREIVIHSLALTQLSETTLHMTVECAAGVYIRSLGKDIAVHLGTTAYLESLRRTAIGKFMVDTQPPGEIILREKLPAAEALYFIETWRTDDSTMRALQQGKTVPSPLGDGLYKIVVEEYFGGLVNVREGIASAQRLIPQN